MDQRPLGLQVPPTPLAAAPDPSHPLAPPPCHPCYELLTELLIGVMHSELSQESNHEQQD
jgi:hypothetical protein